MVKYYEEEISHFLQRGESLHWSDKPKGGVVFRKADIFLIPFSILWCGFAIFWVIMASSMGGLFGLFGLPFVVIGLILVFGRFFIDSRKRKYTVYGITDDRIIMKTGKNTIKLNSVNIKSITQMDYSIKPDGSGTITFGPKIFGQIPTNGLNSFSGLKSVTQLELIFEVQEVYNLILELQNR